MKPRVFFLLNKIEEFDFGDMLRRYLPSDRFDAEIGEMLPQNPGSYQLIVPWSYRKIIKKAEQLGNVLVMHSSALPEGRGWAPIYYAFKEERREYVITGIVANDKTDAGDIAIRAKFPMASEYTAPFLRLVDQEISLMMIFRVLEKWPTGRIKAAKQIGAHSYYPRRTPEDNEIKTNQKLEDVLPHLRGVEPAAPAFFFFNGAKYLIEIRPAFPPSFPPRITFEYPGLSETEMWTAEHDSP